MSTKHKLASGALDVPAFIDRLTKTESREKKLEMLKSETDRVFYEILQLTYNPFVTYLPSGVEELKFSEPCEHVEVFTYNWQHAVHMLKKIASLQIKEQDFEDVLMRVTANLNSVQQEILYRILNKDLQCGIDTQMICETFPKIVPVFGVQECVQGKVEDIKYPVYVEYAHDGQRLLIINESKNLFVYDVSGEIVPDAKLNDKVLAMQSFKKGVVVDCVLEEGALTIVDMLSIGEFKKNKYVREQSDRTARIHEALEDFEIEGVMAAKGSIVNDADRLDRFIKKAVDAGVKAIVTKDTKAVYGVGMTGNWVKVEIAAGENKKKKARKKV